MTPGKNRDRDNAANGCGSPLDVLFALVAEAYNAALLGIGKCGEALELLQAADDDDLREQTERARDMLREAVESLHYCAEHYDVTRPRSFTFGAGTRRHAVWSETDIYATAYCGISGLKSSKVFTYDAAPNCKACARSLAREARDAE